MAESKENKTLLIGGILVVLVAVLWYLLHRKGAPSATAGILQPTPLSAQPSSIAPVNLPASSFTYNYPALAPAAAPAAAPSCFKVCDDCAETQFGPLDTGYGGVPEPTAVAPTYSGGLGATEVANLDSVSYNALPGSAGWTQTGTNAYYAAMGIVNPTFGF